MLQFCLVLFLDHFTQHLKVNQNQAGNSRSEAINANIYAAVLASLKGLVDVKAKTLGNEELKKLAMNIIMSGIISSNANIRCAAAECLGRLAQVLFNYLAHTIRKVKFLSKNSKKQPQHFREFFTQHFF